MNAELVECAAQAETFLGRWGDARLHLVQARALAPRSPTLAQRLGAVLLWTRRYPEAIDACDAAIRLAPQNPASLELKAMAYLAQGDLTGARRVVAERPAEMEAADLVLNLGLYWDLMWVLDAAQQQLLLGLPVEAFGGDVPSRALTFAQTYALAGNTREVRRFAEEAERGFASQLAQNLDNQQVGIAHALSLAYLGRRDEAIREGQRVMELLPLSRDAHSGPYRQHQLVRIYMILGEPDKALDELEPLLKMPYYLSPAWLAIDPNFTPLKGHPRFERLLQRGGETR